MSEMDTIAEYLGVLYRYNSGALTQKQMDGYLHLLGREALPERFKAMYRLLVFQEPTRTNLPINSPLSKIEKQARAKQKIDEGLELVIESGVLTVREKK